MVEGAAPLPEPGRFGGVVLAEQVLSPALSQSDQGPSALADWGCPLSPLSLPIGALLPAPPGCPEARAPLNPCPSYSACGGGNEFRAPLCLS